MMYNSIADTYNEMIPRLLKEGFESNPRGQECYEFIGTSIITRDPTLCTYKNSVREYQWRYLAGELKWYLEGDNSVDGILPYSKFWGNIVNPDGQTVNSNYGHILFKKTGKGGMSQWEWAYRSLVKDLDTRQAIMYLGGPDYQFEGNKDFVCTSNIQFFIRKGVLCTVINQRSCDMNFGLPYDFPFFSLLAQNMLLLLTNKFGLPLVLGPIVHNFGSLHIYNRNEDNLKLAVEAGFEDAAPLKLTKPIVNESGELQELDKSDEVHKLILHYTQE